MRAAITICVSVFALAAWQADARADGGRITAGVLGGLAAGTIIGAAVAAPPVYAAPPPVYYAPPPAYYAPPPPVVVEEPCHIERERYWDGFTWRSRRIQVCD